MALLGSRGDENLLCFFPQKTEVGARLEAATNWVVVSKIFYFHPYFWRWSNLTHIFQMGWNHQLAKIRPSFCFARKKKRGNLREFGVHAQLPPWKLKAPGWPEKIPKRKRRNISTQSRSFTLQKNYHPSDQWCFCLPNLNIHVHPQNSMWILKKSCFFFLQDFLLFQRLIFRWTISNFRGVDDICFCVIHVAYLSKYSQLLFRFLVGSEHVWTWSDVEKIGKTLCQTHNWRSMPAKLRIATYPKRQWASCVFSSFSDSEQTPARPFIEAWMPSKNKRIGGAKSIVPW